MTDTAQYPQQERFYCTVDDVNAWMAESERLTIEAETLVVSPGRGVRARSREFPPCLGCGRPVGRVQEAALTVDQVGMAATFRPCGCVLRIEGT